MLIRFCQSFSPIAPPPSLSLSRFANAITGTVPPKWGAGWVALKDLGLFDNKLSGSLPNEWGNMTKLQLLGLDSNQFRGTLPASWGAMLEMSIFRANDNHLHGSLPESWGAMAKLQILTIDDNYIAGSIPNTWGYTGMASLKVLDARHNHLTGSIPPTLLSSPFICLLLLSDNQFTGRILNLSKTFFEPFCVMSTVDPPRPGKYLATPFRPALLLQNNRLSCALPEPPARPKNMSCAESRADGLARCLAKAAKMLVKGGNISSHSMQPALCDALFSDTCNGNQTFQSMILSGNMFDTNEHGDLPSWGNMSDPYVNRYSRVRVVL